MQLGERIYDNIYGYFCLPMHPACYFSVSTNINKPNNLKIETINQENDGGQKEV